MQVSKAIHRRIEESELIIFDLDGTLVDTEKVAIVVMNQYLESLQIVPTNDLEEVFAGYSSYEAIKRLKERFPIEKSEAEIAQDLSTRYHAALEGGIPAIPAAVEVVHYVADRKRVAIVSGKVTAAMGIRERFERVFGVDEYKISKPDPTGYRYCATELDVDPAKCVVFEDTKVGVLSAKGAEMYVVGINYASAGKQDLSGADVVIESLQTLYGDWQS